jgi:lipopolysaccharide export system permease protein
VIVGILRRTVFWELTKVFLLSLVGITGIIVLAAIVVEASRRGLSPMQILAAIPLIVPSMMPFIIPPTTLFTSCVVYGRLSADNEIIAIRAAGINVLYVIWPGVFLGSMVSCAMMGLYYDLIPRTHQLFAAQVTNDLEEYMYAILKREHELGRRPEFKVEYEIWVSGVDGRKLKDPVFKRRDKKGKYDVARAREAELHVDRQRGEILVKMRDGHLLDANGAHGRFEEYTWSVPLPPLDKRIPSPRDLTWQEILETKTKLVEEQEKKKTEIAGDVTQQVLVGLDRPLDHYEHLRNQLRQIDLRVYSLDAELHMRPALAFGCLFFVLVGCPVGIWFSRSDYLSAFITCFLPIIFIYYPLQLCSTNLAKDGKLHPALALWSANFVLGAMALVLFRKLLKN